VTGAGYRYLTYLMQEAAKDLQKIPAGPERTLATAYIVQCSRDAAMGLPAMSFELFRIAERAKQQAATKGASES
jgi:hypothetical protein